MAEYAKWVCPKCGTEEQQVATLQSELAAAREELSRARAKLILEWTWMGWDEEVAIANATERYAREIATDKGEG